MVKLEMLVFGNALKIDSEDIERRSEKDNGSIVSMTMVCLITLKQLRNKQTE